MAFILHLLDAANVTDVASAEAFIDQQRAFPAVLNPKFVAFVQAITKHYPDLSLEDDDNDNDNNLWEEGLDNQSSYGKVKELVIKVEVADAIVLERLIDVAVKNNLKLYDSEGEVVYP
jgi:hypothetical protein